MLAIRTILHPTDLSERSDLAFRLACSLARDYDARLIVLHVWEPPRPVAGEEGILIPPAMDKDPIRERLLQVQAHDPRVRLEHRFAEGDPAAEILRAAEECRCDVIVMGTHGRTGLSRLLMGSVAERVLRKAPCPVVTVKPPWPQTRPSGEQAPETASGIADE